MLARRGRGMTFRKALPMVARADGTAPRCRRRGCLFPRDCAWFAPFCRSAAAMLAPIERRIAVELDMRRSLRGERPRHGQRAGRRGNPQRHQGIRQLADDSAALDQRRIHRRLRHHEGDVPVGRTAAVAGRRRPDLSRRRRGAEPGGLVQAMILTPPSTYTVLPVRRRAYGVDRKAQV